MKEYLYMILCLAALMAFLTALTYKKGSRKMRISMLIVGCLLYIGAETYQYNRVKEQPLTEEGELRKKPNLYVTAIAVVIIVGGTFRIINRQQSAAK